MPRIDPGSISLADRAIDNRRLTGRALGRLGDDQLRKVRAAVADILDIEGPG